jgi:hypothetical protein
MMNREGFRGLAPSWFKKNKCHNKDLLMDVAGLSGTWIQYQTLGDLISVSLSNGHVDRASINSAFIDLLNTVANIAGTNDLHEAFGQVQRAHAALKSALEPIKDREELKFDETAKNTQLMKKYYKLGKKLSNLLQITIVPGNVVGPVVLSHVVCKFVQKLAALYGCTIEAFMQYE